MTLPPYPYLIGLGIFLALAAIVCYWVADPPAITDWHGKSYFAALVLFATALLAFGSAKRAYELSQPLSVAEGYIVDYTQSRRDSRVEFRTLAGESLKLYAHDQSLWFNKSTLRRITYVPTENDIVLVEYQYGSRFTPEFEDRKWHANIWTFGAYIVYLLIVLREASEGRRSRRGTIGDTVAENFTPEQPGEHWEIITDPDGKEHFANPEDKRPLGSPDIPPEAGA